MDTGKQRGYLEGQRDGQTQRSEKTDCLQPFGTGAEQVSDIGTRGRMGQRVAREGATGAEHVSRRSSC